MLEETGDVARGLQMPENRLRALLADDHVQMYGAVERILGHRFDVEYVADGQALIEALSASSPDVLILDISMPKLSGLEALRKLKDEGAELPPTVVCSMHRESAFLQAAKEAGALGYVYKARAPFDLKEAVEAALEDESFVSNEIG